MASYRLNIRNAVFTQLQTSLSSYPTHFPNQSNFTTPNKSTWVRADIIMPRNPLRSGLVSRDRIDFIAQVDVFIPKGSDDIDAWSIADSLDSTLPINGTPLTYGGQDVFIKTVGSPRPVQIPGQDDAWERYIIEVGMYALVLRT